MVSGSPGAIFTSVDGGRSCCWRVLGRWRWPLFDSINRMMYGVFVSAGPYDSLPSWLLLHRSSLSSSSSESLFEHVDRVADEPDEIQSSSLSARRCRYSGGDCWRGLPPGLATAPSGSARAYSRKVIKEGLSYKTTSSNSPPSLTAAATRTADCDDSQHHVHRRHVHRFAAA